MMNIRRFMLRSAALCLVAIPFNVRAAERPSEIVKLTAWKLTTPFDTAQTGRPDEILQPELDRYTHPRCFYVSDSNDAVVFRAHCGGVTTRNSGYPRCELREMTSDGEDEVAWSTLHAATHVLEAELAIREVPEMKPHVVCVQIHDPENDLLMIRLEGRKLFIERAEGGDVRLNSDYRLGERFQIRIESGNNHVRVWYNGEQRLDWNVKRKGCYYKIGCYTQSNLNQGDQPDSAGEVWLYSLQLDPAGQTPAPQ